MYKVLQTNGSQCYIPSSKPFRIQLCLNCFTIVLQISRPLSNIATSVSIGCVLYKRSQELWASISSHVFYFDTQAYGQGNFHAQNWRIILSAWYVTPISLSLVYANRKVIFCECIRFAGSIPTEVDGFLRVIKIQSTTSFGGEVKPSVPCRRFTACKRTLRAWIEMFRKAKFKSLHFSPKSPDCLPDGSGGHIRIDRTVARPVFQSPTDTNTHDLVTPKRGGKRRPEPMVIIILLLLLDWRIKSFNREYLLSNI
jgi:hypothetical protein